MDNKISSELIKLANKKASTEFMNFPEYDKDNPITDLESALVVLLNDELDELETSEVYDFLCEKLKKKKLKSASTKKFPNGFKSWQETHFEIAGSIYREHCKNNLKGKVFELHEQNGYTALYQLAEELTNKFEKQFENCKWDEDGKDFYEEIECFINVELELFQKK